MKYAAGCFGCLALLLLVSYLVLSFGAGAILSALSEMDPGVASTVGGIMVPIQYINGGCCCLSGVLAIALFAIGSMGGNKDGEM